MKGIRHRKAPYTDASKVSKGIAIARLRRGMGFPKHLGLLLDSV